MSELSPNQILYEDNHLLVVDKPAGVATMGEETGEPTVARMAANYLKRKYSKPGNVFVGIVSRLDKFVSGVLVLARTSKAAGRLSDQIRRQSVKKRYVAWLSDVPDQTVGGNEWQTLRHFVCKNDSAKRVECFDTNAAISIPEDAKEALLRYRVLAASQLGSLVEIELLTGRKHQIRTQFAHLGCPVVGDQKYDWVARQGQQFQRYAIALHASRFELEHPTRKEPMCFRSMAGADWKGLPSDWRDRIDV